MSAAKFRVLVYGQTVNHHNWPGRGLAHAYGGGWHLRSPGPITEISYEGTPIGWTPDEPFQVESIRIEPVGVSPTGTPGTFTSVCGLAAVGGSPTCELERGHEGFHEHTEKDETGKVRTFHWGKGWPSTGDTEARLFRALEVLKYVADVYQSAYVKEAIKEITAEEFVP